MKNNGVKAKVLGMDRKKIAFIICVSNEIYFQECCYYLENLIVPDGYSTDIIAIREADSMCAGYNAAMKSSDAKYKVYLHQDVFIRERNFINKILSIFQNDSQIGLIGMMGGTSMPKTGVAYRAWNVGAVHCVDPDMAYYMYGANDQPEEDVFVEAVDGLLIATQYDIEWREDLFGHFDFYDVSQCFEMRKAGYKVLVPHQDIPWVIHDCNFAKLPFYEEAMQIALKEYPKMFYGDDGFEFVYNKEWNDLSDEIAKAVQSCLDKPSGQKDWATAKGIIDEYRKGEMKSSTLERMGIMVDIHKAELQNKSFSILGSKDSFMEMKWKENYTKRSQE